MTINFGYTKRHDYMGSGNTGPFPYTVPVKDKSQLLIYRATIGSEAYPVVLVNGTDYTVNEDTKEIFLTVALEATETISILINPEFSQPVDLPVGSKFPPQVIEQMLDDGVRLAVAVDEKLDRAVTLVPSSSVGDVLIEQPEAGKFLQVNTTGDKIINSSIDAEVIEAQLESLGSLTGLDNVLTVANNIADVQAVSAISDEVETLANISSDLTTVANLEANIATVLGLQADMATVLSSVAPQTLNYIWNPFMIAQGFREGTNYNFLTTKRLYTFDGWSVARTGFVSGATASKQAVIGPNNSKLLRIRRNSGDTDLSDINLVFNLDRDMSAHLRGKEIVFGFFGRIGFGYSATNDEIAVDIIYTTSSNLEKITDASGVYSNDHNTLQTLTYVLTTSFAEYKNTSTSITIPTNATQVAVRFRYTPTGTAGTSDYFDLTSCYLCVGSGTVNPRPVDTAIAWANALRFYRRTYKPNDENGTQTEHGARPFNTWGGLVPFGAARFYWNYSNMPMVDTPEVSIWAPDGTSGAFGFDSTTTNLGPAGLAYVNEVAVEAQNLVDFTTSSTVFVHFELDARI